MNNKNKNKYPENTAGALMTRKVPIASLFDDIFTVERYLKRKKSELESINYIYVVDQGGFLKGTVSIKEIFRQGKKRKIVEFIEKKLIVVKPLVDGEMVANLALKHNIKSVPVVGGSGEFLGVVLSDTILEIAYRESQEDISRLAGVESVENIKDVSSLSIMDSMKHRLPWLIIGMLGGFLMSKAISSFEQTLAQNIIIASFIPLIVYMGAAVQTQISFFIVRDLAFNPSINFIHYSWKQLRVVFLIALIISSLVFFTSFLFYNDLTVTYILSLAMFFAILSSIMTGVFIPFIFHRLKFDPASASGPIATILQDLISIIVYLLIAKAIIF